MPISQSHCQSSRERTGTHPDRRMVTTWQQEVPRRGTRLTLRFAMFLPILLAIFLFTSPATLKAEPDNSAFLPTVSEEATAPPVTRLNPIAIGAVRPAGEHLVRPRPGVVARMLRTQEKIFPGMSGQASRSATAAYYEEFSRLSSVWVSPEVQVRALGLGHAASSAVSTATLPATAVPDRTIAAPAVQPITAKVLVLAVDFGGSDTFTYYGRDGSTCKYLNVTTTGPLKGEVPHPGPRDNNTVWYDPTQTADPRFYENLIFGHEGVGRVRTDLVDPVDHLPGINLAGYTVQDYFDHMAGVGNVRLEGSVQGWVTVPQSEGYYGAQGCSSSQHDGAGPGSRAQLVVDAVESFMQEHPDYYGDPSPDAFWRQFDANGDGVVDSLWIIHAGMGQEAGGGPQGDFALWSHSSDLRNTSQWPSGYQVYQGGNGGGIVVGPYTMIPENADLGVLVEEFGHNFFGLPDLYTNDIENSIGFWSIMSAGTYAGWLGGATPVGMPLWFRMIAQCGDGPCNWHLPLLTLRHNAEPRTVTIGQLEETPEGSYKGIRIKLPDVVTQGTLNRAGTGKAAYTGTGLDNVDLSLQRSLAIPTTASHLTFSSSWDLEEDRDYGYVMLKDGKSWVFLKDLDSILRESNPNGSNLGWGLTGSGSRTLRFDLTPYRGRKVILRFRYKTDAANTGAGWWIDNLALDGRIFTRFEQASAPATFPSVWQNSNLGWSVVPSATSYPNYYLVEWRTKTKYDRMLQTAYAKNLDDADEWQVERVPYNIPGALLYYCNSLYGTSYKLAPNLTAAPSIGPKYPLLLVDLNYQPMPLDGNGTQLPPRIAGYDAALTLQRTKRFTISQLVTDSGIIEGPWTFRAKPPVTRFDDALGYYAGLYAGPPCDGKYCYANQGGSAVIPAMGKYTTRINHYDGSPYPERYGKKYLGSVLGTGNPGDEGLQWGVRIELLKKSANNKRATLRINAPASE